MDLLSPLRHGVDLAFKGVGVASKTVKVASAVPKLVQQQVFGGNGHHEPPQEQQPSTTQPVAEPSSRPPGGTGSRPRTPRATPGRTGLQDAGVGATKAPPEPTSAAGASGGVAGTTLAPGDAAAAGAPDPTTGTTPRGNRRTNDVAPPARARRRQATTPKRSQVDRRRAAEREAPPTDELVESEGAASPGAQLRVDAPWEGYDKMKAPDIVDRVKASDEAVKAVVRLYEQTHKKRKSILDTTG